MKGQHRLKSRRFRLFVNDGSLHLGEAGFFEHGFEIGLGEAEPLVGVQFAGFFKAVFEQVETMPIRERIRDAGSVGARDIRCVGWRSGPAFVALIGGEVLLPKNANG